MIYFILAIGLLLRLINLNQSLWLDEAIQAWATSSFSLNKLITQFMPTDVHPPLSYLINFFTNKLIGFSEISLRLPSVIFGIITIWLVYKISQLILPKKTQFLPPLLLATSSLHTYYSQEARMYSLITLGVVGSMWALINLIKSKKYLISYLSFSLLAIYSHYLTWLVLPAQLLIVFLTKPKKLKNLIYSQIALILFYLPWIKTLLIQIKAGKIAATTTWGGVVGGVSIKSLSLIPIKFLIGKISINNNLIYGLTLLLPLGLVGYLFYLFIKTRKQNIFEFKIIVSWLFIPVILAVLVSLKIPVLSYPRLLFILPAFYFAMSLAVSHLPSKHGRIAIIALLLINIVSSSVYLFNQKFHRENWKELSQVLIQKNFNNNPVVIISTVKAPLEYYYAGEIINYTDITSGFKASEIWLVPYAEPIFDPTLQTKTILNKLGFKPNFEKHFRGDLILIQYTNEDRN